MRIDFKDENKTIGTAIVDGNGVVQADGDWNEFLSDLFVVNEERGPEKPLKPTDGEEFLRALPGSLRGSRLKAVLVE